MYHHEAKANKNGHSNTILIKKNALNCQLRNTNLIHIFAYKALDYASKIQWKLPI